MNPAVSEIIRERAAADLVQAEQERDLVRQENDDLRRERDDALRERDAYRQMLQIALQQLHDGDQQRRQDQHRHARLVDEYRALREQQMREAA
jgi:uncharacterized protein (DUF3084 family)